MYSGREKMWWKVTQKAEMAVLPLAEQIKREIILF